jgi:type I restriction enzyme S subunit
VKAGWTSKPIGDVFKVVNGGTPKTGVASNWDGPHAWITPAEMGNLDTSFLSESRRTLSDEGLRTGAELVPAGSIILSSRAPIGHLVINQIPMAFNQGCKGLIPSPAIVSKFAYYFLLTNVPLLESLGTGATFKELSGGKLKEVPFHFPELQEQRRIVILLDEAFADIATAKANAEKNLQNARELFESHLDTSFGQRNESWTEKALQDIGSTQTGSTPKTSDQANYGNVLPFIKPGDFAPDGTLNYKNDGLSAQGAASARKVSANSVLMVCIGATIGKCGYADREIATNQQINAFTPVAGVNKKFIYYQMLTKRFQDRVIHGSGQATLPIINKSKWSALTVFLPATLEEQEAIAEKLDAIREETQRLEVIYLQKLTALDDLKKSLLHQAFSGQL